MANEIMDTLETGINYNVTELTFTNKKLASHTKAIEKLMTATKRNMFEISARLLVIKNENLFADDDFKDVFDYAEKMFGYKKNMVYKLVTTAEKFIEQNPQGKGYVSILSHGDTDYTVSQLIELNSIEPDTASTLNEQQVISPTMTTKEIREVIKDYKNGLIDENGNYTKADDTDENDDIEETTETSETVDETATMLIHMVNEIDSITADERVKKNPMFLSKLTEIKGFLSQVSQNL